MDMGYFNPSLLWEYKQGHQHSQVSPLLLLYCEPRLLYTYISPGVVMLTWGFHIQILNDLIYSLDLPVNSKYPLYDTVTKKKRHCNLIQI